MTKNSNKSRSEFEALYTEAANFWRSMSLQPKYGFKIFNGPPTSGAEILFIGYQPGGGHEDWQKEKRIPVHNGVGTHKGWPHVCEYATAEWRLAPKMRYIFGKDRLKNCVGTNVIFLRYPNEACYRNDIGGQRKNIEQFCKERIVFIVQAIKPKRIVTVGFKALEMFGPVETKLLRPGGRGALVKSGQIASREALGMVHLTGARPAVSKDELARLAFYFQT